MVIYLRTTRNKLPVGNLFQILPLPKLTRFVNEKDNRDARQTWHPYRIYTTPYRELKSSVWTVFSVARKDSSLFRSRYLSEQLRAIIFSNCGTLSRTAAIIWNSFTTGCLKLENLLCISAMGNNKLLRKISEMSTNRLEETYKVCE